MNIMIAVLALIGLLICLHFALVYHGRMKPNSQLVPSFCRMDSDSCLSIIKAREARIIGIPNFYLGIVFYLGVLGVSFFPELVPWIMDSLKIASGFTVFVGLVLTYSLLKVLKKKCVLCFAAHILNLVLFLSILFL